MASSRRDKDVLLTKGNRRVGGAALVDLSKTAPKLGKSSAAHDTLINSLRSTLSTDLGGDKESQNRSIVIASVMSNYNQIRYANINVLSRATIMITQDPLLVRTTVGAYTQEQLNEFLNRLVADNTILSNAAMLLFQKLKPGIVLPLDCDTTVNENCLMYLKLKADLYRYIRSVVEYFLDLNVESVSSTAGIAGIIDTGV